LKDRKIAMSGGKLRALVAPAYLLACLLLGGSTQTVWLGLILQLIALATLAWGVMEWQQRPLAREVRQLLWFVGAMVVLVLIHLLPLPPALWSALPGREPVGDGLKLLGLQPGWQPLSLSPYDTITAGRALLPPLALLVAILWLRAYTRTGLAVALLIGTVLGLGLGMLQTSGANATGRFYLQPEYDMNGASGFFANPNFMATLLLANLPFLAALLRSQLNKSARSAQRRQAALVISVAGIPLVLVGLLLNKSLAGLGLAIPVVLLSALVVIKPPQWLVVGIGAGALAACIGFVTLLAVPLDGRLVDHDTAVSLSTRQTFLTTGLAVARDYLPVGAGVGSFERVYRMKENPQTIDPSIVVNHAHDDYLELLIETGIPGMVLVVTFLGWFATMGVRLWRGASSDPFAVAGGITAGMVMVHSLVDFPLRTTAIAATFAMALAMLVQPRRSAESEKQLRPTRHVVV
jgi:O-antigen ligase